MSATHAYRPEIDGLRAVAVAAVVAYHFGANIDGGFVGVDVFFVISGYLIGGLLWSELARTGRIDLPAFWLRRLRRLAPAYLVMALATLAAGYAILLPFDLREAGKEAVAATAWLSNVLFWRSSGYFDGGAHDKPFLHTWSLSVEEQFYLALPLTLLVLIRLGRPVAWLAALWIVSFLACWLLTPSRPSATFYLFPFRAWELLTGVLLAVTAARAGAVAGWIGIAVIGAAILWTPTSGFPGLVALAPVAGTALVLAAGRRGPGWWLALPPAVWVGRLSYSLYLWHWPVLVLALMVEPDLRWPYRGALGVVALILSWLSWRLIETPLRRAPEAGGLRTAPFLALVGTGAALTVAGGLAFWKTDGLPGRFDGDAAAYIAATQDFLQDWSRCTTSPDGPFAGVETCAIGPDGEAPRVLVWGDSHLRALMDGLRDAAADAGTPGLIVWRGGCPPLIGVSKSESASTPAEDADCDRANDRVVAALDELPSVETVLLVGRWAYYASGHGSESERHRIRVRLRDGSSEAWEQQQVVTDAMAATVTALRAGGRRVIVLRQVPELPRFDARRIASGLVHHRMTPAELADRAEPPLAALAARAVPADAVTGAAIRAGADWIDPWPLLCPDHCRAMGADGAVLWFDTNHLTNAGAHALAPLWGRVFE